MFVYKELGFLSGYPFKVNFPLTDCQIADLDSDLFWSELVYRCYYLLKSYHFRVFQPLAVSVAINLQYRPTPTATTSLLIPA